MVANTQQFKMADKYKMAAEMGKLIFHVLLSYRNGCCPNSEANLNQALYVTLLLLVIWNVSCYVHVCTMMMTLAVFAALHV